ncbi:MAG: thiamine-phosphate kinase [bacterium]
MRISDIGEFGLIEHLKKFLKKSSADVLVGIGDDAAVLDVGAKELIILSSDNFIQDVHFDLKYGSYHDIGYKAVGTALSDISAMGGRVSGILMNLGLLKDMELEDIEAIYSGAEEILKKANAQILGGDTSKTDKLFISVSVIGKVSKKHLLTRAGAKIGDKIFLLGNLGESACGFELLKKKGKDMRSISKSQNDLISKHLRPEIRLHEGAKIAESGLASAMIDNSDGLSRSVAEIAKASNVGIKIFKDKLPISDAVKDTVTDLGLNLMDIVLNGAEDYSLIFSVPAKKATVLKKQFKSKVIEIGEVVDKRVYLESSSGKKSSLEGAGFDHFRRTSFWGSIRKDWLKSS